MISHSEDKQADIIDAFNTTSRYLDAILNLNNMVCQIYPSALQINKANTSDNAAAFLTYICPLLMILFLLKFTVNETILILKLAVFHF